ncbi:MAG TPA: ABC transporter substrate-binding protein [Opitutaceae bacterium]|nr:ABC transporter substrate-binding protein [Opitutaceae bacterium]
MTHWDVPIRRTTIVATALVFALAIASVLGGCARKPPVEKSVEGATRVRLQMDWFPQTEYGGYYQAVAREFYREAGLDVEFVPGGPGVPAKESVALGRAEFGMTDGNDVLVAISRGVPLVIVGAEMQHNPQGIMFHAENPLADFTDLDGKTIMAGAGSAWVEYLKRSRNLKFDLLPLTEDLTSFLADEKFIRQCFVTQEPYFAAQRGATIGTMLIANSGYDPYRVIYTSRDYLEKNRETVRAFVVASVRGYVDYISGDPAPAFAALAAANPMMTPDVMQFSLDAMKRLSLVEGDGAAGEHAGVIQRERIEGQIRILSELGLLGRELKANEVADFEIFPLESQ